MSDLTCDVSNNSPVWRTWNLLKWKMPKALGGGSHHLFQFKDAWVSHNKTQIKLEACKQKFPALLLAGVCWIEVAGDPQFIDGLAHNVRTFDWSGRDVIDRNLTITRPPEKTSFGPVSMQLRTAAQTLGLDIDKMGFSERRRLGACLEVDLFNINLAARHLRVLIDRDGLQRNPPELSDPNLMIAATRYNRGAQPSLEEIKRNIGYGKSIINRRSRLISLIS
ncbi:MAG: hypothetical protein ACFB2Z_12650 [Maricaulaceae bacterium]